MKMIRLIIIILALIFSSRFYSQDKIIGTWLTSDNKSHIKIYKQAEFYHGKVTWVKDSIDLETLKPVKDIHNPDLTLRDRDILGLEILNHFRYDSIENKYTHGFFYFPRDGKTYRGKMWMSNDNTMQMRGFVLIFHSTDTWTRVE